MCDCIHVIICIALYRYDFTEEEKYVSHIAVKTQIDRGWLMTVFS